MTLAQIIHGIPRKRFKSSLEYGLESLVRKQSALARSADER